MIRFAIWIIMQIHEITPNCEEMRTMFQKRIRDCDGNVNEYIDVIQDFKQCTIILQ